MDTKQYDLVAWRYKPKTNGGWGWNFVEQKPIDFVNYTVEPLYTKPQTREWVGLTDEKIFSIFGTRRGDANYNHTQLLTGARLIESALKELNHD